MADPAAFDDPGPPIPEPSSRARRALTVAVVLALIISMAFLAFISGRGIIRVSPDVQPRATFVAASPKPSRLAVVDAGGSLVTTDGVGGSVVRYGAAGTAFAFPAWSPDGSRIAAIGQAAGESAVYVFAVRADGAAPTDPLVVYRSTERPPFYLYWAPDSRRLTFLTTEPDGIALRLAPADGSAPATIVRAGSPMYWAWADAARLLVHSGGEGPDGFFAEVGTDGVSLEPVAVVPGGFRAPAVSGDGRFRAFVVAGAGPPAQIVVEARDRSNPHALDVFGGAAIDFGPVTSELAFIAPAKAGEAVALPVGPLRLVDATSGEVRTVLSGSVVAFFWAPDGRTIAALEIAGTGDDQVANAGGAVLTSSIATSGVALRLVFVTVESGAIRSRRPLKLSTVFVEQVIPFFDQYALSHRLWSADSASVVIPIVDDDGTDRLEVIRADGSDARSVADGVVGFWGP
jgi:TolB protein